MVISTFLIFVPAALFSLAIGVIVWFSIPSLPVFAVSWVLAFILLISIKVILIEQLFWRGLFVAWACYIAAVGGVLLAVGYQWSALVVFALLLFAWFCGKCCYLVRSIPLKRLQGRRLGALFSVPWLGRRLPRPEGPARFQLFMCTANVNLDEPPVEWDWNTLGVFHLEPGQTEPYLITSDPSIRYDLRTATMCSAALPIACRPFAIGQKQFLDGGLEANLPAGFLKKQGLLGGRCAICIVPHPIELLNPDDHVEYRTIHFLSTMKMGQAFHQGLSATSQLTGDTWIGPGHTHYPILIVSPERMLESGLVDGFLRSHILHQEFEAGRKTAQALVNAMNEFLAENNEALNPYLLQYKQLPPLLGPVPRPGFWALWANPKWLRKDVNNQHKVSKS
jgi:hypothetical protein